MHVFEQETGTGYHTCECTAIQPAVIQPVYFNWLPSNCHLWTFTINKGWFQPVS